MIRAILIEYNNFALNEIELLLRDFEEIQIIRKFNDTATALGMIEELNPQVVFIDINEPQTNEIDLAIKILEINSKINIVFLSENNQHAVEAFEINATDYILKPLSKKRLEKTIERIVKSCQPIMTTSENHQRIIIKTLGQFSIGLEGKKPVKWRMEKVQELFAFLLHNSNTELSKDVIVENVFPDRNVDNAIHQLHNGIYYIKKTLQDYGIEKKYIEIKGKYMLKVDDVILDRVTIREYLLKNDRNIEDMEIVVKLYNDDYFKGVDCFWAITERDYLLNKYIDVALQLSYEYMKIGRLLEAEVILIKLYEKDPYISDVTKALLNNYKALNRPDLAVKHYQDYELKLKEDLGIRPEAELSRLLYELKSVKK